MIGIDTNVLLRLLIRDDEAQFQRIVAEIRSGAWAGGVVVNPIVLVEAIWVLTIRLGRPKSDAVAFIENLLATDGLTVQHESAVVRALSNWQSAKCGFADCLIAELNVEAGARTTRTFDKEALKLPAFSPIP